MKSFSKTLLAACLSISVSFASYAADKALIIGVGKYADPSANLPGIDLDVALFKRAVKKLGIKDENIKVLMDSQATESNIKYTAKNFLSNVDKNDRVFFYFSGHGSQVEDKNGDEPDGVDEFLVTHEFDGKKGFFTDDEVGEMLRKIPSDYVYAFIDACHSGTATKGLNLISMQNRSIGEAKTVEKFWSWDGMPQAKTASRGILVEASKGDNFVAVTATQDDELALATGKGSIFTLGIENAINKATKSKEITPRKLHKEAVKFVHANTNAGNRFTPSLNGKSSLFDKPIQMQRTSTSGQFWQQMNRAVQQGEALSITSTKSTYSIGDKIGMTVDIPVEGYLNIVNVDENDTATVLYPNKWHQNNKVKKGQLNLGNRNELGFTFKASKPYGKSLTVAFVTKKELNFYKESPQARDNTGKLVASIVELSARAAKGIEVEAAEADIYAGKIITKVK
jgi:hypothetical protein